MPGGSRSRLRLQQVHAQILEILRHPRDERPRAQRVLEALHVEHVRRVALERAPPRQALVEHHARGVPVGLWANRQHRGLLGGHVPGGAHDVAFGRARVDLEDETEVEEHDAALRSDAYVRRLDVAVHLARCVQRVEPQRDLPERIAQPALVEGPRLAYARLGGRHRGICGDGRLHVDVGVSVSAARIWPRPQVDGGRRGRGLRAPRAAAHPREQIDAVDELHREERVVRLGDELAQPDQVRMMDVLQRPELALDPRDGVRVVVQDRLERDPLVALDVDGLVDHSHPTLADPTNHLEARGQGELEKGHDLPSLPRARQFSLTSRARPSPRRHTG